MYEDFFGLSTKPFALTPDPRFLYSSRQHRMALTMLEYGLETNAPLLLLTGDIGSGKTTLVRRLIRDLAGRVQVGLISNTHGGTRSILRWALSALEIAPADESEVGVYESLVDACIDTYARGKRTLLIVDEAQNLADDVLEELRLLSNVNSERDVVLQLLLVGQPELRASLSQPRHRQIAQRVAADYHLSPLGRDDTARYIAHRLAVAGAAREVFTGDAVDLIHRCTGGVPRLVNQLCDYALVYAFAEDHPRVTAAVVGLVLDDRRAFGALPIFSDAPQVAAGIAGKGGAAGSSAVDGALPS